VASRRYASRKTRPWRRGHPGDMGIPISLLSPEARAHGAYRRWRAKPEFRLYFWRRAYAGYTGDMGIPISLASAEARTRGAYRGRGTIFRVPAHPEGMCTPHAWRATAPLVQIGVFPVAGHCQCATALHEQCRGRTAFQHQHSRDSEALHSGETVRALLTHSDNDPLQQSNLYGAVVV
jgi:hypothetical protein